MDRLRNPHAHLGRAAGTDSWLNRSTTTAPMVRTASPDERPSAQLLTRTTTLRFEHRRPVSCHVRARQESILAVPCQPSRMGRPPLPIGMHGEIDFHRARSGRIRARTRVRDLDGVLRAVTRWGSSETEAAARWRVALREQASRGDAEISPQTRLMSATRLWLDELDQSELAVSTRQLYRAAARRYLIPTLGSLCLGELTVPVIERALAAIRSSHGPQPARAARRALSSLCHYAVRHGVLPVNPVRDTRPIVCPRKRVRALTVDEAADLLARLRADPNAIRLDLPDLVEFMLGTGVRIGEACAVREPVLNLMAGTVHINATVVRVNGAGLQIQPRTKTAGSERILHLPPHLVRMLKRRRTTGHPPGPAGVIFTSPNGLIRDPSNTQADLRQALDRAGYPWVSSHVFRKTVASRLDDEGYGIRHIADQLGHSRPSTTLDYYLGRRAITAIDSTDALEPLIGPGE
jgi:integrase